MPYTHTIFSLPFLSLDFALGLDFTSFNAVLAPLTCLMYLGVLLELGVGYRSIPKLKQFEPTTEDLSLPTISVIIPARNEAEKIEEALQSVLALDYPHLEIIVLNDRSTDKTGEVLERLKQQTAALKVIHIETLPEGWLGKNHAMWLGASQASGEYLLFTDADVVYAPDALRRVANVLRSQNPDHLVVMPSIEVPGLLEQVFLAAFFLFFSFYSRPWLVRFRQLPFHIGVGAFNLIRKSTYEAIGTHQAIALRPDDDMKLGKLVKKCGFQQRIVLGTEYLRVSWYENLTEAVKGLEKNAFSGLDYQLLPMVLGVSFMLLFFVWPVFGMIFTGGSTQQYYLLALLLMALCGWDVARYSGYPRWTGLFFWLGTALMAYIIVRATILTYRNKGIYWRDTFYDLKTLRKNQV